VVAPWSSRQGSHTGTKFIGIGSSHLSRVGPPFLLSSCSAVYSSAPPLPSVEGCVVRLSWNHEVGLREPFLLVGGSRTLAGFVTASNMGGGGRRPAEVRVCLSQA